MIKSKTIGSRTLGSRTVGSRAVKKPKTPFVSRVMRRKELKESAIKAKVVKFKK